MELEMDVEDLLNKRKLENKNEHGSSKFADMKEIEKTLNLEEGYRLVINQRSLAGQTVNHLHIHILGGEKLSDKFN